MERISDSDSEQWYESSPSPISWTAQVIEQATEQHGAAGGSIMQIQQQQSSVNKRRRLAAAVEAAAGAGLATGLPPDGAARAAVATLPRSDGVAALAAAVSTAREPPCQASACSSSW